MRLTRPSQAHYDSGPNMTPLVDVVMVILIFLMLAGSFAASEWYLVSNLPFREKGSGGVASASALPDDVTLEIRVDQPRDREGYTAVVGDKKAADVATLTAVLNKQREGFIASGKKADEVQVVISPGRNVKLQYVIDVFQAAQLAQFSKIGFSNAR